jgi:hypothetical protein
MENFLDNWEMNNFFNFFIYSENGSLIYKVISEENIDTSIQGILQAIYFTGEDFNFKLKTLSTDFGLLAFKAFESEKFIKKTNEKFRNINLEKNILFAIIFPNYFGDEDLCDFIMERILDYLFDILIIHIGAIDLFCNKSKELEIFKKQLNIFQYSLEYILRNFFDMNLLLKSEKKLEVSKEVLYPIKHYLEEIKNSMKIDFICLLYNDSIIWASQYW